MSPLVYYSYADDDDDCDLASVVSDLSGLSGFSGNDGFRLDLLQTEQLAAKGTTCLQECQANVVCIAFAQAPGAGCDPS